MNAAASSQPLECPVCMGLFNCVSTVPKVLGTCGHSVCEPCLNRYCVRDEEATCPECRQVSQAPTNGFPSNFSLLSKLAAEAAANLVRGPTTVKCSNCEENVPMAKAFVCATCPQENDAVSVLCAVCGIEGHSGHQMLKLEKLASPLDIRTARTEVHFHLREAKERMDAVESMNAPILDAINGLAQRFVQKCEDLRKKLPAGSPAVKLDLDAAVTGARKLNSDAEATLSLAERFLQHCRTANSDATATSDNAEGPRVGVSDTQRAPFAPGINAKTTTTTTSATGADESDMDARDSSVVELSDDPSSAPAGGKKRRLPDA